MLRTYRSDYAEKAYERFCKKRDREAKREGGARHSHPNFASPKQQVLNTHRESEGQKPADFFFNHNDIIALRRSGKSLEEIAIKTGGSRLSVFRTLQMAPSVKLKISLGVPR